MLFFLRCPHVLFFFMCCGCMKENGHQYFLECRLVVFQLNSKKYSYVVCCGSGPFVVEQGFNFFLSGFCYSLPMCIIEGGVILNRTFLLVIIFISFAKTCCDYDFLLYISFPNYIVLLVLSLYYFTFQLNYYTLTNVLIFR